MKRSASFYLLFLLICLPAMLSAQTLVTCEKYDSAGKPSGQYKSWDIKAEGSYIYLLYNQPALLQTGKWAMRIERDKDSSGKYLLYKTLDFQPRKNKNWYAYDCFFNLPGKYRVTIMQNTVAKASTQFDVAVMSSEGDLPEDYYDDAVISFCQSVKDGRPVGEAASFTLKAAGGVPVTIYLENAGKGFRTRNIFVDIYLEGVKEPVKQYNLDVKEDWDYMSFSHTFTKAGNYTVDMYSGDDIFMTTGTVKITK